MTTPSLISVSSPNTSRLTELRQHLRQLFASLRACVLTRHEFGEFAGDPTAVIVKLNERDFSEGFGGGGLKPAIDRR